LRTFTARNQPGPPATGTVLAQSIEHESEPPRLAKADLRRAPAFLTQVVVLVGVCARVLLFGHSRALWMDEASLALNIVQRSYPQLVKPLAYAQGAPVGFLWLEKFIGSVGGYSDRSLRLLPLIAGCIGLYVVAKLAFRVNEAPVAPITAAMIAFSPFAIYFASEVKQYSVDLLCTAVLLLLFLRSADGEASTATMAIAAVVSMWLSHPATFVVFGCLAVLGLRAYRHRDIHARARYVRLGIICLLNFALLWVLSLRALSKHGYMLAFWASDFMPRLAHTSVQFRWFSDHYLEFFANPAGLLSQLAAVLFVVGCVSMHYRKRAALALILAPLWPLLFACFLHKYPLSGRLLLFLLPIAAIVVAEGVASVARLTQPLRWRPVYGLVLVVLGAGLLVPAARAIRSTLSTPDGLNVQEMPQVLAYVRSHREPNDIEFVDCIARTSFLYYSRAEDLDHTFITRHTCLPGCLRRDLRKVVGKRVWVISNRVPSPVPRPGNSGAMLSCEEVVTGMLDQLAPHLDGIHVPSGMRFYVGGDVGVSAWLYDLRHASPEALAGGEFCDEK
jgi:Dolichyl-phosphate-mannose-protein mannosyltransferase